MGRLYYRHAYPTAASPASKPTAAVRAGSNTGPRNMDFFDTPTSQPAPPPLL